jgi:hypothetical protein
MPVITRGRLCALALRRRTATWDRENADCEKTALLRLRVVLARRLPEHGFQRSSVWWFGSAVRAKPATKPW